MVSEGSAVFELVEPTSDEGYNGGEYGMYVLRMTPAVSDRGKKSLERTGLGAQIYLSAMGRKLKCGKDDGGGGHPLTIPDATVVAASPSDEKLQIAKQLGAKYPINYRKTPDWSADLLKATDIVGVDLLLDVVGADSIEQAVKATRFGGGVVTLLGLLSEDPTKKVDIMQDLLFGAKTMRGQLGAGNREMADELLACLEKHQVHPQIAGVFEFDQADKALEATVKLAKPGKIVMRV
ncbi:hypothetical protein B0A55_03087 [Friedmanniomyces simplex]|uniref:Alcohol dehydrogenase-like C-terminal domain-containing protein n=1 Tax=Friedmanniomyces simplex TaxID=329884 RepID=A0A4U0XLC9_9PEZI|nr:hypothetical protein B0A55_03087 [Friedmanniomyces simplex]